MSHVAEGLLHAYLDGAVGPDEQLEWARAEAHLEVCGDCRRRLEQARELRTAAASLLAGGAPVMAPARPEFASLRAAADARRTTGETSGPDRSAGHWWRTPMKLAWAASLVMAVGAGWIGRQLMVEQGIDAPRVAAEQDAPVGRTAVQEGAALDDLRGDATPEEARARRDAAAAPTAAETAARFRVEAEPRPGGPPELEELQEKAEPRTDADPEADADAEAGADAIRMQEIAPLTAAAEAPSGARCYAASRAAAGDGREAKAGKPETLRLAPDGTATLQLDGRPMVGFWRRAEADSLHLRVTDGQQWRELALIEVASGARGDAELQAVDCP